MCMHVYLLTPRVSRAHRPRCDSRPSLPATVWAHGDSAHQGRLELDFAPVRVAVSKGRRKWGSILNTQLRILYTYTAHMLSHVVARRPVAGGFRCPS